MKQLAVAPTGSPDLIEQLQRLGDGHLPGLLGIEITAAEPGEVRSRLSLRRSHRAGNGYLHAASVVALADTSAGYGCQVSLPAGATGFTTAELKSNFLSTATEGALACRAWLVHGGRTTQVWDAEVTHEETGRTLALFRCTQVLLYPRERPGPLSPRERPGPRAA
ncbi:MAG: PaaI family thioesterase [Acidimicrobiia bacterium]